MKTKEFNKIKPYTYLVIRLSDNKKYHGVRWGNKMPPIKDLGVVYFTSSKEIRNEFKFKFYIHIIFYPYFCML